MGWFNHQPSIKINQQKSTLQSHGSIHGSHAFIVFSAWKGQRTTHETGTGMNSTYNMPKLQRSRCGDKLCIKIVQLVYMGTCQLLLFVYYHNRKPTKLRYINHICCLLLCIKSSVDIVCLILDLKIFNDTLNKHSLKLTYSLKKANLKMIVLFQRWDMLVFFSRILQHYNCNFQTFPRLCNSHIPTSCSLPPPQRRSLDINNWWMSSSNDATNMSGPDLTERDLVRFFSDFPKVGQVLKRC